MMYMSLQVRKVVVGLSDLAAHQDLLGPYLCSGIAVSPPGCSSRIQHINTNQCARMLYSSSCFEQDDIWRTWLLVIDTDNETVLGLQTSTEAYSIFGLLFLALTVSRYSPQKRDRMNVQCS